jgi:hypothetical protein
MRTRSKSTIRVRQFFVQYRSYPRSRSLAAFAAGTVFRALENTSRRPTQL